MARSIIISGASRGIGAAIAEKLAASGDRLGLLARNESELSALAARLRGTASGTIHISACDISDEPALTSSTSALLSALGSLDACICNAGVGTFAPVLSTSAAEWDAQMNTNARGSFLLARECARSMTQRGGGHIIFIASDAATRTFANGTSYCASKYAQLAVANAMRKELRAANIKVTTIMPGLVASTFNNGDPSNPSKAAHLRPADVADAVAYALSTPPNVCVDEIVLHPMCQDW